jgi:hypothetical protein
MNDKLEIIGFSHWASALINGDDSGLEPDDREMLEDWLAQLPENATGPVDAVDEGFCYNIWNGLGGDAAIFVFLIE